MKESRPGEWLPMTDSDLNEVLLLLSELINFDINLAYIPMVIGSDNYAKLLSTFAGHTIKFPSRDEIKKISKRVNKLRYKLKKFKRTDESKQLRDLLSIGKDLGSEDVRTVAKVRLTDKLVDKYLEQVFTDSKISKDLTGGLKNVSDDKKLRAYDSLTNRLGTQLKMIDMLSNLKKNNKDNN